MLFSFKVSISAPTPANKIIGKYYSRFKIFEIFVIISQASKVMLKFQIFSQVLPSPNPISWLLASRFPPRNI